MISGAAWFRLASAIVMAVVLLAWWNDRRERPSADAVAAAAELLMQGKTAEASAAYHDLLAADPGDRSARSGRDFCRRQLGESGFADGMTQAVPGEALLAATCAAVVLLVFGGIRRTERRDRIAALLLVLGSIVGVAVSATAILSDWERRQGRRDPIRVLGRAAVLRTGNNDDYPAAGEGPLKPGAEVRIRHVRGSWCRVVRPDGLVAWLPQSCLIEPAGLE